MMKLETARLTEFMFYPKHVRLGLKYKYPMCCILYFALTHRYMKYEVPKLNENPEDRIMCPDCIVRSLA